MKHLTKIIVVVLMVLFRPSLTRAANSCECVVSLAPSITETLYALNLGDSVGGVTRYCRYPVEAMGKPKVGGFLDPNIEAIAGLNPDIVFTLVESHQVASDVRKLGLKVVSVDNRSVSDILRSIRTIGSVCNRVEEAEALVKKIEGELDDAKKSVTNKASVKTLITVGRTYESGRVASVFVSGSDGFYSEVLKFAGGENVNKGVTIGVPTVSAEGLMALKPEAIIEIIDNESERAMSDTELVQMWRSFTTIPAVKNGRVFILRADYASVPGPRIGLLVKDIAKILHGS